MSLPAPPENLTTWQGHIPWSISQYELFGMLYISVFWHPNQTVFHTEIHNVDQWFGSRVASCLSQKRSVDADPFAVLHAKLYLVKNYLGG